MDEIEGERAAPLSGLARTRICVVALVALSGACEPVWPLPYGSQTVEVQPGLIIAQTFSGDITGLDTLEGVVLWRYDPDPRIHPPYLIWPPPRLLCPPLVTPDQTIVLRYTEYIIAIDTRGQEKWRIKDRGWSDARQDLLCGAAAPNSDTIFYSYGGVAYERINSAGEVRGLVPIAFAGRPEAAPVVLRGSGDVVIQTEKWVLCFSPDGTLNWKSRDRHELKRGGRAG